MINLYDILKAANGQLFGEPAANLFTEFCLEPAQAGANKLFVALRTDRGDTHQYIEEAIGHGATGILCVDPPTCDTTGVSVLMVRDTIDALMAWSRYTLRKLDVKAIAIAGSSSRSVTSAAVGQVLNTRYRVHVGEVDVSGRLAVPLSLAQLTSEYDYVVLKFDATFPGEMAMIIEAVQPEIALITNIDCVHPAAFESCDQYVQELTQLISALQSGGMAVLNYDDDRTRSLASRAADDITVKMIGIDRFGADILAFNVKVGLERIGFDLRYEGERYVARWSPLLGKHHLYGILAAVQIAVYNDIEIETALKQISELETLAGRMSLLSGQNGLILVDDTFSASHSSTLSALDWLADVRADGQRLLFVLGDMDGLGSNARYGHRSVGQRAAQIADIIITQGVSAALAGRAAVDAGKDAASVHTLYSTDDVVASLRAYDLNQNDIVLVKGGRTAALERVVAELLADPQDREKLVRRDTPDTTSQPALRPSWIEVDADALARNTQIIRQQIGDSVAMMAVIKADAYGHGSVLVARTALANGADYLAVASMAEAVELRDAGINAPLLVLSYAPAETVRQAHRLNLTLTVYDLEQARLYDRAARTVSGKLKVHIKIETGMGRLGLFADDAVRSFRVLQAFSNLDIEGMYTHLSTAEVDLDYTDVQIDIFQSVIRPLKAAGVAPQYIHAANTPGTLAGSQYHFTMVRPGLMLYGLQPHRDMPLPEGMQAALSWKTSVLQVKTFPPGHSIGYGRTYRTRRQETIAILPVGYADGLRRSPQTWEYVLIHGQRAPLVGRVSMEKCAVNVSDVPNVTAGDEVVLLGQQGEERITAEMIADWLGTINYEVVTTIVPRIPRR